MVGRWLATVISVLFLGTVLAQAEELTDERAKSGSIDWSKPYIGLHAGVGIGTAKYFGTTDDPPAGFGSFDATGFEGGIFAGYMHQFGYFVLGIEVDASIGGPSGKGSMSANDWCGALTLCGPSIDEFWRYKINGWGSARLRAGVAKSNALFFVTGGVAAARTRWHNPAGAPNVTYDPDIGPRLDFKETAFGYILGAGFEIAPNETYRIKGEILYTDLGDINYVPLTSSSESHGVSFDFVTVRIGASVPLN